MTPIRIRVLRHSAFYTPLLVTIAAGFLAEEGLQPHYDIATADKTVPSGIASGEIHVAQSAVATAFAGLERGETPQLAHFAQINARDGFFLTSREPSSRQFQWTDLAGKAVLVDHFFQPLAMLRYALFKQGVRWEDLQVIDAGDVHAIDTAFRQGRGDYVHQQGPAAQQLEFDGFGQVVAAVGEAIGAVAFSSLCAHRDWLKTPMARQFMRAYRKALQYAITTPAASIARLEADYFPGIHPQVLTDTIATYQRLGTWQLDPAISRAAYETTLDVFAYSQLIQQRHEYEKVICVPPDSTG
jgi:NitT/TauT family transport system substrate-binding protein